MFTRTITPTCPQCGKKFTIELLSAEREILALKREVSDLKAKIAATEAMYRGGSSAMDDLKKMFGM
jgi:hypothetical protein